MHTNAALIAAVGLAAACTTTLGQTTKIATVSDADAEIAGMLTITDGSSRSPAIADDAGNGHRAINQMPGFPITIGRHPNFAPFRGTVLADIDGQPGLEILQSATDGRLHAWHNDGTPVAGFPVTTTGFPQYPPSVADLDGDGDAEIVFSTRGITSGGRLYALDNAGVPLAGFPVSISNRNVECSPVLYDLDGDGQLEIIAQTRAYPIGYIHVFEMNGSEWGGNWPFAMSHVPTCTPGVADIDNDGLPELFTMSYDQMYLLTAAGTPEAGWPRTIANASFSYQSPALADLDGDGDLEITIACHKDAAGTYVFHHDGTLAAGWPQSFDTWSYCAPTVTDLEGDGDLEIIAGQAGIFFGYSDCFWVWDAAGNTRSGFPYADPINGGGSEGPLTVADIDGDDTLEIFADHNIMASDMGFLYGVDAAGNDLPDFPLRPHGFTYLNSATVADVDGNGTNELAVLSYYDGGCDVNLYTLPGSYTVTGREWSTYHARNTHDGLYAPDDGCYADFNGDGAVNTIDVLAFLNAWATSDPAADCDGSGTINTIDVLCFLNAWAAGC